MKIFLAQCRKDLVLLRVLFGIWLGCIVVEIASSLLQSPSLHVTPGSQDLGLVASFLLLNLGSIGVQALVVMLLITGLVQADPLTEVDAFWRTRPIPRATLLAEKALFAVILVTGATLAARCITPGGIHSSTLLSLAVFAAGLMAFASVTSTLSQLILNFLGLVVGPKFLVLVLWGIGHASMAMHTSSFSNGSSRSMNFNFGGPPDAGGTPASLGIPCAYLACLAAIIAFQYLTLKTVVSRWMLFATFLGLTLWAKFAG